MKITQERLDKIVESHGKWLCDEEGGERADLSNADLRNADLSNADLSNAVLSNADLSNADLRNADLSNADLRNAVLSNADLSGAVFEKTYYQITRIGSRNGTTTYCVEDDNVLCGCWNDYKGGTLAEFEERIESVYGERGKTPNGKYYIQYMEAIKFFKAMKTLNENKAEQR